MKLNEITNEIISYIQSSNSSTPKLTGDTKLLEEVLDFDSLDLAGLVAYLEEITDFDPFEGGFVEFETISELAQLFIKQ